MTLIVGIVNNHNVYVGSDRLGSTSYIKQNYHTTKIIKLFATQGIITHSVLIGVTGSYRFANLINASLTLPHIHENQSMESYLITEVVPTLIELFDENGFTSITNNVKTSEGSALIGIRGQLFNLQSDFSILETQTEFAAVGSGQAYALGALEMTKGIDPEKRIKKVVKAVSKFCPSVGKKSTIMSI